MSTCGGCPASWAGHVVAHCGACHRTFSRVSGFDRHRSQDGERGACLDPAALTPPMVLRDDRWRKASDARNAQRLATLRGRHDEEAV